MLRPRRRPWLILVWTAIGFLALQAGLGVLIEGWLPAVYDPEYAQKEAHLRARLAEAPGKPLVLVLGSSRPMMGVQAGRLQELFGPDGPVVYNFAVPGAGPMRLTVLLERLLECGIRPDFVLLEILPPMFNDNGGTSLEENWMQGDRYSFQELRRLAPFHGRWSRLMRHWSWGRLVPCWKHAPGIRYLLSVDDCGVGPEGEPDGHGWLSLFGEGLRPDELKKRTEAAHRQYAPTFHDFRLAERPKQAMNGLLDRCRKERIPTALMLMPEGTTFRSWYPPDMVVGYEKVVADLCRRHHLPLIDARLWVDDEGFNDSHHMFPRGAEQFTDRLAREVFPEHVLPALREPARRVATSPP